MPNVNLLQFRTVTAAVNQYSNDNTIEEKHKAFLALVLENFLDLDIYDIEDAIIDGSYDGGIDAIYIDERDNTERPNVYLFQSKYYTNENKFDRNFEGGAITKMKEAINDFILSKKRDKIYQNSNLQDKLNDIDKLENPIYNIVFCSSSDHPNSTTKEIMKDFIEGINPTGYFSVTYLHLQEISKMLAPKQTRIVNYKLRFSGNYINDDKGDVRMFLGQIPATEIAKLRHDEGREIFDKNVRGYLSRRNEINKDIQKTASSEDSPYFLYLNNGLTIVCDDYSFTPVKESPTLEISNLQIVNGGQTTNSIYESYVKKELNEDTYLLVKVLQIKKEDLLEKIIISTNSQTKVTSRDLRSNDSIQKLIEREMESYGFYYEARKNKYKNDKEKKLNRVDAEIAAQAFYAAIKREPAVAKNKKSRLFTDFYESIFNENTKSVDLLVSYLIYKNVRQLNKKHRTKYTFVNDASLHTSSMLYTLGIKSLDDVTDIKKFEKLYLQVLKATKEVVNEKIKEEKDAYSHRKTFIDPLTIGRITEAFKDLKIKN